MDIRKSLTSIQILWEESAVLDMIFLTKIRNLIKFLLIDNSVEVLAEIAMKFLKFFYVLTENLFGCIQKLNLSLKYFSQHSWVPIDSPIYKLILSTENLCSPRRKKSKITRKCLENIIKVFNKLRVHTIPLNTNNTKNWKSFYKF